jgi:hypothetical protein
VPETATYRKGLTEFNYWNYPDINPLLFPSNLPINTDYLHHSASLTTHRELSRGYRKLYESDDTEAIWCTVGYSADRSLSNRKGIGHAERTREATDCYGAANVCDGFVAI